MACGPAAGHRPVVFGTQNACGVLPLSPREERAGRESERGETDKKCLLSPALSSFLRRRGRENAVARSKQIFCRTQLVCDPQQPPLEFQFSTWFNALFTDNHAAAHRAALRL